MRRRLTALVAIVSSLMIGLVILGAAPQQGIPQFPIIYGGDVTVQDNPVPTNISLIVCVGGCDSWASDPVMTLQGGRYFGLAARPPEALLRQEVTFWIVEPESGQRIMAAETDTFVPDNNIQRTLNLTFSDPIPTPPPAAPPTNTPAPTQVVIPPVPGDPSVQTLSRVAVFAGIAALLVGGAALYLVRRRGAF
ncbi:MAG: hypothetical protein J4F46_06630 [Dehalococcoidia bacterium]|nr:hypothetical protein [Dehalococcoidia bacterium]